MRVLPLISLTIIYVGFLVKWSGFGGIVFVVMTTNSFQQHEK